MIREKVLKTIREHNLIENNQHIVTGLSGGPDSVCLFHILLSLREEMNLTIHPVHINHKFRPGAAEEDQAYVEKICLEKGCPCRVYEVDCNRIAEEKRISSEEAGRLVRYEAFAEVCKELRAGGTEAESIKIAVAQNADDQAETILFRILRGAGTDGLAGIKYSRRDQYGNEIVRPVLDLTRKEIEKYCEENNLDPRTDKTNLEPVYTRNKIRLNLIPYIEENFNTGIKETLVRMGHNAAKDSDYIWKEAEKIYRNAVSEENDSHVVLKGKLLINLHSAVLMRVISMALGHIGINEDIGAVHFEACESIVLNKKPSARADLPGNAYITKVYDDVKIALNEDRKTVTVRTEVLSYEEYRKINAEKDKTAAFDYDLLEECFGVDFEKNVTVRKRLQGDYIAINSEHRKKLKDYFIDNKVPKDERDKISLLSSGSEILWIMPGVSKGRYSGRYKLCADTKKVFFVEIISMI